MLRAAARRFLGLLGIAAAGALLGSLLLALISGTPVQRSISLGFYLVGSFLLLAGFFVGNRGRARVDSTEDGGALVLRSPRRLRIVSQEEQQETIATSAIFIALGVALLLVGVAVDPGHTLF